MKILVPLMVLLSLTAGTYAALTTAERMYEAGAVMQWATELR